MHIAFLTPEYPHQKIASSAGIGTSIKNLADGLVKKEVKVSVFVYSQDQDDFFVDDNIHIYKIGRKKYFFLGWYFHRRFINKKINKVIQKENISLIEIPDWTGISAFMKFPCPLVIKIHGSDTYFCYIENRKQKFKNYYFEKKAIKSADFIVAVSNYSAEITRNVFSLKKEIEIIPNAMNTNYFSPTLPNTEKDKSILYFGSVIRKKGILDLACIFNHVVEFDNKATLTIIGKDVIDFKEKISTISLFYERLNESAKQKVNYLGSIPYNQVPDKIRSATVIVLPSYAEAFPMTWLEAMALEKVLIASNIGWATEIIDERVNGFMRKPENHEEYANIIIEVINNKELRDKIGKAARKKIALNFSQEVITEKSKQYYSKLISKS